MRTKKEQPIKFRRRFGRPRPRPEPALGAAKGQLPRLIRRGITEVALWQPKARARGPSKDTGPTARRCSPASSCATSIVFRPGRAVRDTLLLWLQILCAWAAVALWPEWWVAALAIPIIGSRYYALYIIGHDGLHRRLFSRPALNDLWNDVAIIGAIGAVTRLNRANHMRHHATLALPNDPDRYKYCAANKPTRLQYAAALTGLPYVIRAVGNVFLARAATTQPAAEAAGTERYARRDVIILIGWQVALLGGLTCAIGWWAYPVLWLAPRLRLRLRRRHHSCLSRALDARRRFRDIGDADHRAAARGLSPQVKICRALRELNAGALAWPLRACRSHPVGWPVRTHSITSRPPTPRPSGSRDISGARCTMRFCASASHPKIRSSTSVRRAIGPTIIPIISRLGIPTRARSPLPGSTTARSFSSRLHPGVQFVHADGRDLPFADEFIRLRSFERRHRARRIAPAPGGVHRRGLSRRSQGGLHNHAEPLVSHRVPHHPARRALAAAKSVPRSSCGNRQGILCAGREISICFPRMSCVGSAGILGSVRDRGSRA